MAGGDPNIEDIVGICVSEERAIEFARSHGLILNQDALDNVQLQANHCVLGTVNCNGHPELCMVHDKRRNKQYERVRCSKCRKYRSAKNGINNGQINSQEKRSFFAKIDRLGKNQTKFQIRQALYITWCWSKNISLKETHSILGNIIGINNDHALTDWRNYLREITKRNVEDAPQMGGPGQVVRIYETLMRRPRKYNRSRMLEGNRHPSAQQNDSNPVAGPWVFAIVWSRPDGKQEMRMFPVLRRNESTIQPLVLRHVAPNTEIWSDEWETYQNIPVWGNANYLHRTANHQDFLNPLNVVHTQRMEAMWRHVKSHLLRTIKGTNEDLLEAHLNEYRWRLLHQETPFNDLIAEIARQYPLI